MFDITPVADYAVTEPRERRQMILAATHQIGQMEQWDFTPTRVFAPGSMAQTLVMPKGLKIVGKIHKHAHLNIIAHGRCLVFTEQDGVLDLRGPLVFTSHPGTQRVVWVLEDTHWTTIHITDETDPEKIEDHVIAKSFEEYDSFLLEANRQLQLEMKT